MQQNIVIEMSANTAGITSAKDAVENLTDVDKSLKDQFDITNKSLKERETAMDRNVSGLDAYSKKLKDVEKAAVGAFGTKSIKEYQDAISKTLKDTVATFNLSDQQAKKFFKNLRDEAKKGLLAGGTDDEMNQFRASLEAANEALKQFGEGTDEVQGKTQSFKSRLRELKEEMSALEASGDDNSEAFINMAAEAANLEDQIGDTAARIKAMSSDTFAFDAVISGIQGVASAFQVGQGAVELFGDSNDQLQQALVKLNAIMAITQGLQQVRQTLERQSAVMIAVTNAQQKISILQTGLQKAAESDYVVVRYSAIAAQKLLNLAMNANPAGVLLTIITAAAGALLYFTDTTDEATEKQKAFNEELKNELDLLESVNKQASKPLEDRVKALQNELTALKDKNVAQGVILQKEKQILLAQQDLAGFNKGFYANEIEDLGEISAQIENQSEKIKQLKDQLSAKENEGLLSKWFTVGNKSKTELTDQLTAAQGVLENLQKQQETGSTALDTANKTSADLEAKNAAIVKYNREQAIKSAIAGSEARVAKEIEGTNKWLRAELNAIEVKRNADLSNVDLTEGERAKIIAQARDAQAKAEFDFDQKQKDIAIKSIDARAGLNREGTKERLDLELRSLEVQKQKELQQYVIVDGERIRVRDLTTKQLQEIDDRYLKSYLDKNREYNQKVQDDTLSSKVAATNSTISQLTLAGADTTNQQLLLAKENLLKLEAEKERLAVDRSIDTAENKRIRIKAINDKELLDKKQLEDQKYLTEYEQDKAYLASAIQQQALLNNALFASKQINATQLADLNIGIYNAEKLARDRDLSELKKQLDNKIITISEYNQKVLDITNANLSAMAALKEQEKQLDEVIYQRKKDLVEGFYNGVMDTIMGNEQARIQQEMQDNQNLLDSKLITQAEFNKRQKQLQKEQAAIGKEKAIFDIFVAGAKAIFEIQAQAAILASNPFTAVLAAKALAQIPLVLLTEALQIGFIAARKFRHGVIGLDGAGTETSDSIPAFLSRNESVMTAEETRKHRPLLQAIRDDRVNEYLASFTVAHSFEMPKFNFPQLQFEYPKMGPLPKWAENQTGSAAAIDYEKLADLIGKKVAKHQGNLSDIPGVDVNIDENGIAIIAKKGLDKIQYLNKRYGF